jgi:hypothetical protein
VDGDTTRGSPRSLFCIPLLDRELRCTRAVARPVIERTGITSAKANATYSRSNSTPAMWTAHAPALEISR